jgi:anaerobic magnesium-protoporphyrin IX monomethyl ester cyclase
MRITFLNPPGPGGTTWHKEIHRCGDLVRTGERWPPTGLAQLAAVAHAAGAEVALIDGMLTPREPELVAERARAGRPELLVVLTSTPTLRHDLAFAAPLGGALVAIGTHPSARPDDALALGADAVIAGEPEGPLAELLARGAEPAAWEGIEAVVTRPGQPTPRPARVADLDALPPPVRDLIEPARYTFPLADGAPFASVQVARGCPFACRFCRTPAFSGGPPRHASVAWVMAELQGIHASGIRHVALMADTFTADRGWVMALCEALRAADLDLSWYVATRPDRLDPALAGAMAAAGCRGVALGVEAASEAQLARMGKGIIRPETAQREAVEAVRGAGMFALGYFVLGYPGETRADLLATLRLALALPLDHAFFHAATPFPGTALFDECLDGGLLTSNDWARYEESSLPVITTPWLMPEEVHAACRLGQIAFYARPGVIARELGRTRSLAGLASRLRAGAALVGIGG